MRVRRGALGLTYVSVGGARPQVAVAVSRKVGNAVCRNRCRRRLRAAFDACDRAGRLRSGAYLVQVYARIDAVPSAAIAADVDAVLDALTARLAA